MMSKEGSTKILNLIAPEAGVLCRGMVKKWTCNISSPLLVYTRAWIRQIKYKAIMTKERSVMIVNFITLGAGGLMLGRGYISHYSEYALSSTLSIYITLIAIVLREYNTAFLCNCWFLFILWWGSWYANMNPSDKKSV